MSVVELKHITKRYGGIAAVHDVSLTIEHGRLVCILGPSGCGKTTTLRLIAGFVELDEGEIRVGERTISAPGRSLPPERRNMSMIFQSYALWPHMTVAENVAYGLTLRRLPRSEIAARVDAILAVTRLAALADRYPTELSGGQQQRAALARALIVDPETLLLDEPLSNLDANLREEMRFEIRRLHETYRYTTVYVTHDQAEAMTTADLIVVMNQGRIEQAGSPEAIYQRPGSEFVARFIGGTNIFRGRRLDANLVDCDGLLLCCASGDFPRDGATAVSVRPHDIELAAADGRAVEQQNETIGTVTRQIFLGAHRDYVVDLPDSRQVRVVARPDIDVPVGRQVHLRLPPECCRALAH
ncbi:MAG: ABC transporter ATP-binding protein [Proteobacteria bacterium]|nr:ABC transporter ATP-binding protein [Pseudomonadota bacterium]